MRLIAQKRMRYGTRALAAGDAFDATDKHARLLLLARAAAEVLPELKDEEDAEPGKKRRYKRRDMQAEE